MQFAREMHRNVEFIMKFKLVFGRDSDGGYSRLGRGNLDGL